MSRKEMSMTGERMEPIACPFCGGGAAHGLWADRRMAVRCLRCDAKGPSTDAVPEVCINIRPFIDQAIAAWNRRALLPPPENSLEGGEKGARASRATSGDPNSPTDALSGEPSAAETILDRFHRVSAGRNYQAALGFLRLPARYIDLGQACERHGLAWFADDGEMLFQAPDDVIAEQAVAPLYEQFAKVGELLRLVAETYDCEDEDFRSSGRRLLDEALQRVGAPLKEAQQSMPEVYRRLSLWDAAAVESARTTPADALRGEDSSSVASRGGTASPKSEGPRPSEMVLIPRTPPDELLMSMAVRQDHALGVPGYYDQDFFGAEKISHHARISVALSDMRKVYEEVVGDGFYRPERADRYREMMGRAAPPTSSASQSGEAVPPPSATDAPNTSPKSSAEGG